MHDLGDFHQALTADLSTEAGLDSLCAYINSTRIQLLINNAGYSVLEPFYRSDLALQQNILDLNCRAVVTLAHTFLQQAEQGDARSIEVDSSHLWVQMKPEVLRAIADTLGRSAQAS